MTEKLRGFAFLVPIVCPAHKYLPYTMKRRKFNIILNLLNESVILPRWFVTSVRAREVS
jgi:hypothetical protein